MRDPGPWPTMFGKAKEESKKTFCHGFIRTIICPCGSKASRVANRSLRRCQIRGRLRTRQRRAKKERKEVPLILLVLAKDSIFRPFDQASLICFQLAKVLIQKFKA
ncbi:hypothetical protein SUGI_0199400 [Cryptomeria japonica]|nr:hypothetical protein SUGI_0199400 [Cryptomeria japonica]